MELRKIIEDLLRETDSHRIRKLFDFADRVRARYVGNFVHLRGLIEFSNHCERNCYYCGIRKSNKRLARYRMSAGEILACVEKAVELGYGTVVLQSGEDHEISPRWIANLIEEIKKTFPDLAVTLSVGEYPEEVYKLWRDSGADRYLLKFETSDMKLYRIIHPPLHDKEPNRLEHLQVLKKLGYQVGGGIMVGLPGQTYSGIAQDILLFRELDLDMIGIGPYIPHPDTPMGRRYRKRRFFGADEVPNTDIMTEKVIAITRILCPEANIPATTALASVDPCGFQGGLKVGANVVMPNLTPIKYRSLYEIYPGSISRATEEIHSSVIKAIHSIGRWEGKSRGDRVKGSEEANAPTSNLEDIYRALLG